MTANTSHGTLMVTKVQIKVRDDVESTMNA